MFNESMETQVIGTLKIFEKETGEVLVQKRNAIHPGNMAYVIASALAGSATSVNSDGAAPYINWMAFGNGGSSSTTTLAYRSPRVFSVYDQLPITSSNSTLYAKTYQQKITKDDPSGMSNVEIYYPGQEMDNGEVIPNNTSKINFQITVDHDKFAEMQDSTIPESDNTENKEFTIDEIGLLSGVTNGDEYLEEDKTLMMTHVTFHPVLLSANRTIVIDYTITIQIN